ncbi:zinc finger protein sens-like [Ruditapes philippinarum]|uniref:zinc finger protein sens-like n=1 Tax=Ruditapes philippinarum TaxID=129788 RepID=UPI00295BA523|nr:zinc finger protein sens-like [Ruditapes philippinarum]
MYKQSSSVRKHSKSGMERRSSETLSVQSFESSSSQSVLQVKDEDTSTGDTVKSPDMISQSEISKSFEEAWIDLYSSAADEQMDSSNVNLSANQSEEQEYERLMQAQGGGASARDDSTSGSTKKYGKGNFIKVATGYQCRICCRVIRHMNNTTAHMRIHANVKPYKCQVCNQQFKYEVDRRYHFSKNHVDLFSKMYFPDEKKSG